MKPFIVLVLAVLLTVSMVAGASAQSTDSIWLTASTTAYKTGETVVVTLNAVSATPIQGFTFQVRYDPACLKPVNASSPMKGMNGLPLPQLSGLVDGSYASTTPQAVNGVLAEIRFTALGGCQTNLTLESAALAIRNEQGFAAPLPGVSLGEKSVALNIDKELGAPQAAAPETGSLLPLDPPAARKAFPGWAFGVVGILFFAGVLFGVVKVYGSRAAPAAAKPPSSSRGTVSLHMKHGPLAGKSFALTKLPCLIGRDPANDIYLNDPHVIAQHARIFTSNNAYYLMDLGGETVINGRAVRRSSVLLNPGDVVRLGKRSLFVFG